MHDAVIRARLHATLWLIHRGMMEQAVADYEALKGCLRSETASASVT